MTIRRYSRTTVFGLNRRYGTSEVILTLRNGLNNGNIRSDLYITKENERLDIIAGERYKDSTLWWLIASCSNIGWSLQVPSNTRLLIPYLEDVIKYVG